MSHLACAETPEHPLNERQIRLFREVRILYRGIPASLANSSGIFLGNAAHCDLVRPGRRALRRQPDAGHSQSDAAGDRAGGAHRAGAQRRARRHHRLRRDLDRPAAPAASPIVAVGYADGYLRAAGATDETPGGDAIVAGKRCPLAGRVSMDLLAIDVTALPDGAARRGELVTLIGDEITVDDVANAAGTIGYEVLTSLGGAITGSTGGLKLVPRPGTSRTRNR